MILLIDENFLLVGANVSGRELYVKKIMGKRYGDSHGFARVKCKDCGRLKMKEHRIDPPGKYF